MVDAMDMIRCLYCQKAASVTVTSELRGMLAHYPCCDEHVERAAHQMRSERGRERVGRDPFSDEMLTLLTTRPFDQQVIEGITE